jgi:Ni/Co efflux regulator RcnB
MKRIGKLLLVIAVGASLPAMAMAQRGQGDPDRNGNQREDRGQHQGGGQQRAEQAQRAQQPQRQDQPRPEQPRQDQAQAQQIRPDQAQRPRPDGQRQYNAQDYNRDRTPNRNFAGSGQPRGDDRRDYGNRPNDGRGYDGRGNDGRNYGGRDNDGRGYDVRREDGRRFDNGRYTNPGRGNDRWVGSNWRQDRRYDWRGYRDTNRNQFHIGRYVAPRGWGYGYRRYSIGAVLPSLLWGSSFWLDDPYDYRLPPAYAPYRWVRYYDDVLLIDTRTGRVVDSIPGFFW